MLANPFLAAGCSPAKHRGGSPKPVLEVPPHNREGRSPLVIASGTFTYNQIGTGELAREAHKNSLTSLGHVSGYPLKMLQVIMNLL